MPNIYACKDCQFWHDSPARMTATCRVSHPSEWRNTAPNDWCGRFHPINEALFWHTPPVAAVRFPPEAPPTGEHP